MEQFFRKIKISALASGFAVGNASLNKALASKLIDMRGIPAKFVQIKALTEKEDEELWKEAVQEIEPLSIQEIEKILESRSSFISGELQLDRNFPAKPASIGQVHKAKTKDGQNIAVKVRYPGIEKQLLSDLDFLGMAGKLFSYMKNGFSQMDYQEMIRDQLESEMDFNLECRNQSNFLTNFLGHKQIIIPRVFPHLSSDSILCQEWQESEPLNEYLAQASNEDRTEISDLISEFYFQSLFQFGLVHTDPNPGNFGIRKEDGTICLIVYDFGSVYRLSAQEKLALWGLIENQLNRKWDDLSLLSILGFDLNLLKKVHAQIPAYLSVILEPFLVKTRYNLSNWNRKERCKDILGEDKLQFMIAAPARIFPILRVFQGLFHWCERCSNDVWIYRMIFETQMKLHSDLKALTSEFPMSDLAFSSTLRIEVWRNGLLTVGLDLPRYSVDNLEQLIDPEIQKKIKENGMDINEIQRKARENAYQPMDLLQWEGDGKRIRIALE